jgi:hypothetical protein
MRFFILVLLLAPFGINAQVMQNTDYQRELEHAKSLLAGTASTDIPHHIHYDLKLYDRDGHESTATYDIYRDPVMYQRIDVKAVDYQLTQISNVRDHKTWQHYSGDKPLKIGDFEQAMEMPTAAIDRFAKEPQRIGKMLPQQLQGMPLLCANDNAGTAICFSPFIRLFAYAQMFNQTVLYDNWLPVGSHTVPGNIRIYEDKKLLVEATGTVEVTKKFPPHFMEVPETPSQPDPGSLHKILQSKGMDLSQPRFGNAALRLSVNGNGHVTKAEIVDSDDRHIEGPAKKFARQLIFENGNAVPFETVIYVEYYPLF